MLYRHTISPAFVGREQELRTLENLLDQADKGQGAMVLIGGDTGIGKTRLCRELKTIAAHRNVRVVEGRCSRGEMSVPYGPFVDALRFRLAKGEGDAATQVLQPILAHVAPLFRGLGGETTQEDSAQATSEPFERIQTVFTRLASLGTVLFVVEDIHWADSTSIDLLHYMAREVAKLPLLLVVTHRTDEGMDSGSADLLVTRLTLARAATRLRLEPLSRADVQRMLEAMLGRLTDDDLASKVYERTEGNPLFVEEFAGTLTEEGALRSVQAPATLHEMVLERIAPLDADAREALNYGAIIGRRFHFDVLAAVLAWPEERLLTALEQLILRRIIVEAEDGEGESYSFRHIIVQEVLYGSFIGRRRKSMHRNVAVAIESTGSAGPLPHSTLAHHYQASGDFTRARYHTVLAGDEAARLCAWREATKLYQAAYALAERDSAGDAVEADILERLAEVAWWQNQLDAHEHYLVRTLRMRRDLGDTQRAAGLLRKLARVVAYQRKDPAEASEMLEEALRLISQNTVERIYILNDLGRLQLKQGHWATATKLFEESLRASSERGDCAEETLSLAMLGVLAIHSGQIRAGISRLELARALLDEETLPVERAAEVYHAGIRAFEAAREHQLAREWLRAAIAYAEAHGAHADLAVYRAYRAAVQRRFGEWVPAVRTAEEAVDALRRAGRAEYREALRILGDLHRVHGEVGTARQLYEQAIGLGESDARVGVALLDLMDQKWHEGAAQLESVLEACVPDDALFAMRVLPFLVESYVCGGQIDAARAALKRLADLVAASDYRAGPAIIAEASGVLLGATGDRKTAIAQLRDAAKRWDALTLPLETARSCALLAEQLLQTEDGEAEAISLATEAVQRFDALGAARDVARAQLLLRRGGVRVARKRVSAEQVSGPLSALTRRELEVFKELARGNTNREIARTLSLSTRTVDNHVSSILAKLGCTTRTQAALLLQVSPPPG